jgi:ankyrin repeat protein
LDEIDYESTPLFFAIEHGNEAIVSELLNAGASPSQADSTGRFRVSSVFGQKLLRSPLQA